MMTQPGRILGIAVFVAILLLLPLRAAAQTGTVTDDAFLSINPTTQQVNANGYGMVLIVAGSSATGSPGTTMTFLKFQLQSSLPPNVAANNVAKATLKLFLANQGPSPNGAINIYPVTSAWTEATLNPASPPTLATTPFATGIDVGTQETFLVVDVTQLVQDWLNGPANGGLANDGLALVANSSATFVEFDSKENVHTSHEPRLEIVLVDAGAQGPAGPQGAQGATGPQGPAGTAGAAATVQVGATMTVPAGTPASVLNAGSPNAALLNFLIPQGLVGAQGPQGPGGPAGPTGTTGATGPVGPAGPVGATGATGATGQQGPQGPAGPAGAIGPQGPQGPAGPAGSGGGFNGLQEFTSSGSFTVPSGVTHLLVEMWGGGGGAGGPGLGGFAPPCNNLPGGNGGSGAYLRAVVAVTPGNTYSVSVGASGALGSASSTAGAFGGTGAAGGDSELTNSSGVVLLDVAGGMGGSGSSAGTTFTLSVGSPPTVEILCNTASIAGAPGAGGSMPTGTGVVGRAGNPGDMAVPPAGSISLPPGVGTGGTNGLTGGGSGGPGYVLLTW